VKQGSAHFGEQGVRVVKNRALWRSLPSSMKRRIEEGVASLRDVKADIERQARVPVMPPVSVVAHEAWVSYVDGEMYGTVYGRAGLVPSISGEFVTVGAHLCGATLAGATTAELRRVLIHEFLHALYYLQHAFTSGSVESEHDPNDAQKDAHLMVEPSRWFGPGDSAAPILHDDPRLNRLSEWIASEWIARDLPTADAFCRMDYQGKLAVDDAIFDHIQTLKLTP
jgi:hypothetical protein